MSAADVCGFERLSRRAFLVTSGATSCAVLFGGIGRAAAQNGANELTPNIWVTLHADGVIDIVSPGIELGQGTSTTLPRFLAEELDADWEQVRVIPAPADEKRFGNPLFWGIQITAGSRTCLGFFDVLRIAGAQARLVLLAAAAERLRVPASELSTGRSIVTHKPSGRQIAYGDLVQAAKIPESFPQFVAPGEVPQVVDEFFGEPPPSTLLETPERKDAPRLKARQEYVLIGKDAPRHDIPEKVAGKAQYGIDVTVPDMVLATVVTAPVRDDIPASIDDAAARAIPGVNDVFALPYGVAIVGTNTASVLRARAALAVKWEPGPRKGGYDSAKVMDEFTALAAQTGGDAVRIWGRGEPQEVAGAFAGGRRIGIDIRSELVYHAPIEPQNATIRIAPDGKSAEVWVGSQWPQNEKVAVAEILNIPPDAVTLYAVSVGGSFGRRQEPGAVIDAAHIAKRIGKPVKVVWSRDEDLRRNPFRQALACRAEAVLGEDGRIAALRHRVVADSWFARLFPDWFGQYQQTDPGNWTGALCSYDVPLQEIEAVTARRDVDVCYMRGIGVAQVKFAQETLVDLAARQAEADPFVYRKLLLANEPRALGVLDAVARMSDWPRHSANATGDRALGLAYTPYSNAHAALVADVSLNRNTGQIAVHEIWCAVDVGMAAQPDVVASQIEGGILQGLSIALLEEVTLERGVVQQFSFGDYRLLTIAQAPKLTVEVLSTPGPIAGAGEIGTMQIAPAINNALLKMTGVAMTTLPMTGDRVLRRLQAERPGAAAVADGPFPATGAAGVEAALHSAAAV